MEEPLELSEAHERLLELNEKTARVRDDLFETFTTVDHYDTMTSHEDGALAERAEQTAAREASIASELRMASHTSNESPVNQQVLESVSTEFGRLTAEVASVLAQT